MTPATRQTLHNSLQWLARGAFWLAVVLAGILTVSFAGATP